MGAGDLVIVGGAERPRRAEILRVFVDLAGGPGGRFLIIPTATEDPLGGHERMRTWLGELGVPAGRVELLELSSAIPGWAEGAEDPAQVAKIGEANGIWFLGGDQNRTIKLLLGLDGSETRALKAIRRRQAEGAVLGGTSAGASVMCDPMIGGGSSFGALALPRAPSLAETTAGASPGSDERRLFVTRGLGFFPCGIVDQHFDTRARLGRLLEAALVEDGGRRLAFGVAEATALVYRAVEGRIEVAGSGGLYIVDTRVARRGSLRGRTSIEGAILHYLRPGDRWLLAAGHAEFGGDEEIGPAEASFAVERPCASGVLSSYGGLAEFAARMLLDNKPECLHLDPRTGLRYARSWLIEDDGAGEMAWELRLSRSAGAPGGPPPSRLFHGAGYSFENVVVDILPVEMRIDRYR